MEGMCVLFSVFFPLDAVDVALVYEHANKVLIDATWTLRASNRGVTSLKTGMSASLVSTKHPRRIIYTISSDF